MSDPQAAYAPPEAEAEGEGEQAWDPNDESGPEWTDRDQAETDMPRKQKLTRVEFDADADPPPRPLPPHLKDISSLASWTVSTHKPLCGTAALRHPSPSYFWQSDGPQPHTLNIHFTKLVSIAHLRFYVDSKYDESYTPTRMLFLAGTGHYDLQVVAEVELPAVVRGWTDVPLEGAGGARAVREGEIGSSDEDSHSSASSSAEDSQDEQNAANPPPKRRKDARAETLRRRVKRKEERAWRRIGTGPTLRCFLVQLRILENNQNGKDTHLRGLQIFARDEGFVFERRKKKGGKKGMLGNGVVEGVGEGGREVQLDEVNEGPVTRARAKRRERSSLVMEDVEMTEGGEEGGGTSRRGHVGESGGGSNGPIEAGPIQRQGDGRGSRLTGDDLMRELELRFGEPELR